MQMKKLIKALSKVVFPKYGHYTPLIVKNRIKKLLVKLPKHQFLFILSPPYCGSTILSEIIASSPHVSTNNPFGTREGQTLPTVRKIMFHDKRWDAKVDYEWNFIQREWMKYWDLSKAILLEKSPSNLFRAKSIEQSFAPVSFIIFYRNPYAQCESLIRRDERAAADAAKIAISCLENQKKNIENLKNSIHFSYEDLVAQPNEIKQKILAFYPDLGEIKINQKFLSHNLLNQKISLQNLNQKKIKLLNKNQLEAINHIFRAKVELLNYFNYELVEG